jgi:cystathionine beta-lyase family protein involved in aluminum resistance
LLAVSEQEKYQNESSETYPTTLSEVIPILSSTLNAVQELTVKYTTSDTTNKDNIEAQELIHRISESIECIKAWNSLNTMNGTTVNNLVEQDDHPVVHGVNNVIANDE